MRDAGQPDDAVEKTRAIVVVEDEAVVLDLLREVLEGEGYRVISLSTPDQLDALPDDIDADLVFMDLMLPGESGLRAAQRIRAELFPHAAMIAMSADRLSLLFAQRSALFQGTLRKPFEVETLIALTRQNAGRYVSS